MNKAEPRPIELVIVAAWVVIEALLVVVVAVAALIVTLAQWRPAAATAAPTPEPPVIKAPAAPPLQHPLAALVAELQQLPVTRLRQMAGTRSKAIRKADLIEMVAACS